MKKSTRAALAIPVLLLLGACGLNGGTSSSASKATSADSGSGGSTASTPGGSAADTARRGPANVYGGAAKASASGADIANTGLQTGPLSRSVISTGQITLHSSQLQRARAEVERLVASYDGTIADEKTSGDERGRITDSSLVVRVPTARFDDAMQALTGVGEVEQQNRSSQDVTTQVIDNSTRVRAAEASIRSIQNLLSRAKRLGDVIAIENDLAQRQANLDSLKRQQAWLDDQTSLSTINVYLSLPMKHHAKKVVAKGFLAGLAHGWHAFGAATVIAMTVIGAVLPFALVVALVGVPLWWLVRRRRPVAAPPAAEA